MCSRSAGNAEVVAITNVHLFRFIFAYVITTPLCLSTFGKGLKKGLKKNFRGLRKKYPEDSLRWDSGDCGGGPHGTLRIA
jgi:hypothetical protein